MPGTQRENKVIDCLAAVAWKANKPLVVETVQVAPPRSGEVRIKAERSGICYSDIAMLTGTFPEARFPCILGHECAAIVESVGLGVENVKRGDLVITLWNSQHDLNDGNYTKQYASRITCGGKEIYKIGPLAAFSEYSVVPQNCVLKVDSKAPIERISPFSCSVPTGYQAAKTLAQVHKWSSVVIFGLGAVGMSVALACRDRNAKRIIGVDKNSNKAKTAKLFGCTDFINPDESDKPVHEVIKEMTGDGVDYAFVCFGGKQTVDDAIEAAGTGSSLTILVGLNDNENKIGTNFTNLLNGKSISGTWCGAHKDEKEVKALLDKYIAGQLIEADYLTTHTISLDKINEGLDTKSSGNSIRTAIIF